MAGKGLTKQYAKYVASGIFNAIGTRSNLIITEKKGSLLCTVGAAELVHIWNVKTGQKVATLSGDKHEVTRVEESPNGRQLAVGYSNGTINVFDLNSGEVTVEFSGHTSAVTALGFDSGGMRLVSGSNDTDVILWDMVEERSLYRLTLHKGPITCARFMKEKNYLVTSSKDTHVRFWDLDAQHCFKTMTHHQTEVYGFVFDADESRIITGSADSELRVFGLEYGDSMEPDEKRQKTTDEDGNDGVDTSGLDVIPKEEDERLIKFQKLGSVTRAGNGRLVSMEISADSRVLCCHGVDKKLELFNLQTKEEVKKRALKKVKKLSRDPASTVTEVMVTAKDMLLRMATVTAPSKLVSCTSYVKKGQKEATVACLLANNSVQMYSFEVAKGDTPVSQSQSLVRAGHRSEVRAVAFSSDNLSIVSGSGDSIKVWNRSRLQCIVSLPSDYILCCTFTPGDRHVIAGTKSGKLHIFDIGAARLVETINAHSKPIWSLCLKPDKSGIITGSGNGEVRFWNFTLVTDSQSTGKQLGLEHKRTLEDLEDVLSVKVVQTTLAVATMDSNIYVFYVDTLKRRLALYGHKSPALCLDISSDAELLISGSADRNIKVWGLYHGNCLKSIFAHDDNITNVQFIPDTHMAFSSSKDRKVKFWDMDSHAELATLEGHHKEVWSLAVSPNGKHVVSCSSDKTLRLWDRSDEPLILEEEQEMAREKEYEEAALEGETKVPGEAVSAEADLVSRKTLGSVRGTELLSEAMEFYGAESAKPAAPAGTPPHQLLQAYELDTPEAYVLMVLRKIKSSHLENSLLSLPFSYIHDLMMLLEGYVSKNKDIELSTRCFCFLLRIHHQNITSNETFVTLVDKARKTFPEKICAFKDLIGFNNAGLAYLKQKLEERKQVTLFTDATANRKVKRKKEKKRLMMKMV